MDQISSLDFLEYFDFLKKVCLKMKISIWGGLERAGVKDCTYLVLEHIIIII